MNINKKGQSQIITTVLIILLVLAAVVIVWQVVQGTIESGAKNIEEKSKCIDINLDIVKATAGSTANLAITRKAGGADDDVTDVRVLVDGISQATTIGAIKVLETKTIGIVLVAGNVVEVAAQLGTGSGIIVCDVSGTYTV